MAAGYIDDGSPLYISYRRVIKAIVRYCHFLLGRTDELHDSPEAALLKAFGLGAQPAIAEVENLMDSLPRLAGYQYPKPLPPAWNQLIKLTAPWWTTRLSCAGRRCILKNQCPDCSHRGSTGRHRRRGGSQLRDGVPVRLVAVDIPKVLLSEGRLRA